MSPTGLRFVSLEQFCRDWLMDIGQWVSDDNLERRRIALESLIHGQLPDLEYFGPDQLKEGPGYAEAFQNTIRECERQGLEYDELQDRDSARLQDLGRIWQMVDESLGWKSSDGSADSGERISPGQVLSAIHEKNPEWPTSIGPVLAIMDRPTQLEESVLDRIEDETEFIGYQLTTPVPMPGEPDTHSDQNGNDGSSNLLGSLKARLFRTEQYFENPAGESDESVRFEEYSSPEREAEAAVQWVLQTMNEGVEAEDIAIVTADGDQTGVLQSYLSEACQNLDVDTALFDLQDGLSIGEMPRGHAILLLIRALRHNLRQDEMVRLLPLLDLGDDGVELSTPAWRELIFESGMIGGSRARPEDADRWLDDVDRKIDQLSDELEELDEDGEDPRQPHSHHKLSRWLGGLQSAQDPLEELVEIQRSIKPRIDDRDPMDLMVLWQDVKQFADKYLKMSYRGLNYLESLNDTVEQSLPPDVSKSVVGEHAIDVLQSLVSESTFGHPENRSGAVTIGTLSSTHYQSFETIRIVGLTENTMPDVPREDPILPDHLRRSLNETLSDDARRGLDLSQDAARTDRRRLYQLVESTGNEMVFTTTRKDREGTKRSFSSLFVDLSLASGMKDDDDETTIPDESFLRVKMTDGRQSIKDRFFPLRPDDSIEKDDESNQRILPSDWSEPDDSIDDLERIISLRSTEQDGTVLGIMDGMLPDDIPAEILNGLTEERHLSASAGKTMLQCPHWFLLKRLLDYDEPPEAPPSSKFSGLHFGSLVHRTAESLYERLQDDDGSHELGIKHLDEVVEDEFEDMTQEYALIGEDAKKREKNRLKKTIKQLLDIDRQRLHREMDLEEHVTGLGEDGLYLHGYLDRVEILDGDTAFIRDLKSGSAKTDDDILPDVDVQLGIYYEALRNQSEMDIEEVSYIYPVTPWHPERTFTRSPDEDDDEFPLKRLSDRTSTWLSMIKTLLESRDFPRTEDEDDCQWCSFKPVCGARAQERSKEKIESVDPHWKNEFLNRKEDADT